MNNDGSGQPDVMPHEVSTPLDATPAVTASRKDHINERLQAFRQLFVGGENAVLPRFREISRGAVDKALHVFSGINIPESHESEEQLPECDIDLQLLELWQLRSGGDEAVFAKMMELFDKYRENCVKYPNLKNRDSSWKYIAPSTITNLRAAAWLAMDDPTKFDDFLIEKGEWKERDFSLHDSVRYYPSSTNAIATVCQALDLSFRVKSENQLTPLDVAARDETAQIFGFRGSKDPDRIKFHRSINAEIPEEFIPMLRRALVLANAGIKSNNVVLIPTLTSVGRAIDSNRSGWADASLYLLYLHQQAGLIDHPEFRGTVSKLRDTIFQIYAYDPALRQQMIQDLADRYGFKFLYDKKFWKYKEEETSPDDEPTDILGFELKPIRAKANELRRLGPKRKFNAAASIGQSAARYISVGDDNLRKTRMYEDVMREKEEISEVERKRRRITTQYLEVVDRTMGKALPLEAQEVPFTDEEDIRRGLELFLISFQNDLELSPASKALIQRIKSANNKGESLTNDSYQINMRAISRDPFLSRAIRHFSEQKNYKEFVKLSKSTDMERLLNMEFLTRYMAYKILNYSGTERAGSAFILHQAEADDTKELSERCMSRVFSLSEIQEKDSGREKRFLMHAIDEFGDQDIKEIEVIEEIETESPESRRDLRQRLLEITGNLSKELKAMGTYAKERRMSNLERVGLTVTLLALAGVVILHNPSVREDTQLYSQIARIYKSINPFDNPSNETTTAMAPVSIDQNQSRRIHTSFSPVIFTPADVSEAKPINAQPHTTKTGTQETTEVPAAPQRVDIKDRYASLSIEGINNSRERKIVGQVINSNGISNGQGLGFMPEVVDGFDYVETETAVSPVFMSEVDIIGKYSDHDGLVVMSTLSRNERTAPIGNRDLEEVIIVGNFDNGRLTEDPLQALTNVGESDIVVYSVLSPENGSRMWEVDEMKVTPYEINNDFQAARALLAKLKLESNITQVYSSMIESFETALNNNASQEELSELLVQELNKFETNFVNQQYYSLDFDFNSSTVAEQLSLTPEQGYDCNAAAVLLQELLQPLGIQAGTVSGVNVSNFDGRAWTNGIGHVRVLVGLPNGKVVEVDFTPGVVPGRTPEENINNLQQSASDNLPTDAEYIAPSQPKSEEQEAAMEIPTEKPKTEQPEVVLTITTLLALIGKYYKKNRLNNNKPEHVTKTEASLEPPKKTLRTTCITNILDMLVPLSVTASEKEVPVVQQQAMSLLYAAFSLDGDQLKRLNELIENAIQIGSNRSPINSKNNAMLEELGLLNEEYSNRLVKDDFDGFIEAPGMPTRRNLIYRFMIDNGWKDNGWRM